jgi:hypothetical protein
MVSMRNNITCSKDCNHGTIHRWNTVCFRYIFVNSLHKGDKYNNDNIAGSRLSTVRVFNGGALRQTAVTQTATAGLQADRMITTNFPATTLPLKTVQSVPWHSVCCKHDGKPYLANTNNYCPYLRLQKLEVSDVTSALLNSTISQYHTLLRPLLYWNTVVP